MRGWIWSGLAVALLVLAGCNEAPLTRTEVQERANRKSLFNTGPDGMILSDPMKRDVAAWYRQTYILYQADHNRLEYELKENSPKGVKIWANNVLQDLRAMREALANESDQERLDKIVADYEYIKSRGMARQNISLALNQMYNVRKDVREYLAPESVVLRQKEIIDDAPPEKPKEDEDSPTQPVKPKW